MDGFIGEIRAFSFDYEPVGWIFCDGRSLPYATNQALFFNHRLHLWRLGKQL